MQGTVVSVCPVEGVCQVECLWKARTSWPELAPLPPRGAAEMASTTLEEDESEEDEDEDEDIAVGRLLKSRLFESADVILSAHYPVRVVRNLLNRFWGGRATAGSDGSDSDAEDRDRDGV